jgi:hypothetical protein
MVSPQHSMVPSPTITISDLSAPFEADIKHDSLVSTPYARSESSLDAAPEPRVVTWDDNDPDNPQNWSYRYKWFITLICGLLTLNVCVSFGKPLFF